MTNKQLTRISKFLSLVLRHEPERIGLQLDASGWVGLETLLEACRRHREPIERAELEEVVATNDKKRFAFNSNGDKIRASQGHSIEVSLDYAPVTPPSRLFHGTTMRFLESIRREGLDKRERHHLHLSADAETARKVGERHGKPAVLIVNAQAMHERGHAFFLSENGVWLTEHVPTEFIELPDSAAPSQRDLTRTPVNN